MCAPFRTIDELRITKARQGVTKLNLHQGVHAMVYYFSKTMPVGFDEAARSLVSEGGTEIVALTLGHQCALLVDVRSGPGKTPRE